MNKTLIISLLIISNVLSLFFYNKLKNNNLALNEKLNNCVENFKQEKIINDSIKKSLLIKKISNVKANDKYSKFVLDSSEIISYINVLERQKLYIPNKIPVNGKYFISQNYWEGHEAIDFSLEPKTEIIASASGAVDSTYEDQFLGKVIIIDHLNGYKTLYAHLDTIFAKRKNFVNKEDIIALSGNTGENSSGYHLHFAMYFDEKPINPEKILKK